MQSSKKKKKKYQMNMLLLNNVKKIYLNMNWKKKVLKLQNLKIKGEK